MAARTVAPAQLSSKMLSHRTFARQPARVSRPAARPMVPHAGAVTELEGVEGFEKFIAQEGLTVIDFYTTWCGPCKLIAPKVEEMAEQMSGAKFGKLNLTDMPGAGPFTKAREVKSLPTFHIYKNGVKLDQMTGNNPTGLRQLVSAAIAGSSS